MHALFAASAPGLERWLAAELEDLGIGRLRVEPGGVSFAGDDRTLYRVALGSGLTIALRLRLGTFVARRFEQVVRGSARLPWARWIGRRAPVSVKVTCRKSRLYHSSAVGERILEGLHQAGVRPLPDADGPRWAVQARLVDDQCTVSIDVGGEPLYQRGYRLATAKAPLRPDLARALLAVAGWDPETPLIDPFCGAGTLCIEAATMARRLPPGRLRDFAFMRAPGFDEAEWREVSRSMLAAARPEAPALIVGSDRDAGAIAAAKDNAERAGVDVRFEVAPLGRASAILAPPEPPGLWASNPPYGRRTGDLTKLRNLYQSIKKHRDALPVGWRLALVIGDGPLARATGAPLESRVLTDHGGIKVRMMVEPDHRPHD